MNSSSSKFVPKEIPTTSLPIQMNENLITETLEKAQKTKQWVIVFVLGTKPCFYKFYGAVMEAEKQGIPYLVINSDQHYDALLTEGEREMGYAERIAVHLAIRGDLAQKSSEIITKISWFAKFLKEKWPTVTAIPLVLGDTIMCPMVSAAWIFSREEKAIHYEAGLRSMTASCLKNAKELSPKDFIEQQFNGPWQLLTNEPFPEQWDSFVASKGSEFLFAPLEINRDHLIREGYPPERIWLTGGVVVDAFKKRLNERPTQSVFKLYPQLEQGKWLRVDIHRKENQVQFRLEAILSCIERLVHEGHNVCFIEMNATRDSIDKFGYRKRLEELQKNKNFLQTSIWPEYAQVLEFYSSEHCLAAVTDSGGLQEEMNLLGKPCFTVRFSTDRPETVMSSHGNILVPPVSGEFMARVLSYALGNTQLLDSMSKAKKLYGEEPAKKLISTLKSLMSESWTPFSWAHDELDLGP